MKNLALILATMCIFAQATSVLQTPAFLEFKQTPFGSSLSALIELNMSFSGRLDAIAEVLNTVQQTLHARVEHNDAEISRERGWCADTQANLSEQIADAEKTLSQLEEEQLNLETEQRDVTNNLEKARQSLSDNQHNLENTEQQLVEENDRFAVAAADYAEAIAACDQALTLLATLRANPTGFIQSKARFGNVVVLLQKHLANKSSSFVQPVLTILSELSTSSQQIDQVKLTKVVSLIESLVAELRNQQSQNEQRHKDSVSNLSQQIVDLQDVINQEKTHIEQAEKRLGEIANRLAALAEFIAEVKKVIAAFQKSLQDNKDTCSGYDQSYSFVDAEIKQQIATLEKLKEYFKNNVVPSAENVRDSAFADELTVPL